LIIISSYPDPDHDKPNRTVERIELTEAQKEEIKLILEGKPTKKTIENQKNRGVNIERWLKYRKPFSMSNRIQIIKQKYYGSLCHICSRFPNYKVTYENWLQCPRCAFLCPIYETEPKETIQDTVTTIENPFESAQGQVLGVYKKGIRRKKKRQKHPDKDIELEIKQHGQDNVKVIQDTNP